jgi:hypothetical protein
MANYYATTRSNYFRAKDAGAFEAWCAKRQLDFWTTYEEGIGERYAIAANDGDGAGWPHYDPEQNADIEFTDELAKHLDPRDVAVLLEVGSEKLRYLVGEALAVYHDARTVGVHLDEIYQRAADEFSGDFTITEATY